MEFLFSYILQELTVEKLKELDNNSDGILEISDFLNCIPDSTSITSLCIYLFLEWIRMEICNLMKNLIQNGREDSV